jgi:hypothetical protein
LLVSLLLLASLVLLAFMLLLSSLLLHAFLLLLAFVQLFSPTLPSLEFPSLGAKEAAFLEVPLVGAEG